MKIRWIEREPKRINGGGSIPPRRAALLVVDDLPACRVAGCDWPARYRDRTRGARCAGCAVGDLQLDRDLSTGRVVMLLTADEADSVEA